MSSVIRNVGQYSSIFGVKAALNRWVFKRNLDLKEISVSAVLHFYGTFSRKLLENFRDNSLNFRVLTAEMYSYFYFPSTVALTCCHVHEIWACSGGKSSCKQPGSLDSDMQQTNDLTPERLQEVMRHLRPRHRSSPTQIWEQSHFLPQNQILSLPDFLWTFRVT